jgi:PPP family 3-phenylpropionic acid transporter
MQANEKQGRSLTVSYSIIQAVLIMGYSTFFMFAAVYLLSRGLTNTQVGITMTLSSLAGILFVPALADFADKSKKLTLKQITMIVAGFTLILAVILLFVPSNIFLVGGLFVLLQVFFGSQTSLITSLAMEHINSGTPVNFSLARGVGSLAFALLSMGLGFLVNRFGTTVIILGDILLMLLIILLVGLFPRPAGRPQHHLTEEPQAAGLVEFAKKNVVFIAVVFALTLIFISHNLINTFLIRVIEHVGGDNSSLGIAAAVAAFAEVPAMALFPLLYRRRPDAALYLKIAGAFFVIKSLATLIASSVGGIYAAQTLEAVSYAIFTPASVYYVNQVIPDVDKVKGQSLMMLTTSMSGLISNLAGGFILDSSGGVPLMLIIGTAVSALGLILLFAIDRPRPQPQPALD